MIVECTHPDHLIDATGRIDCPALNCLAAAIDRSDVGQRPNPMDRVPAQRPDWILSSPDVLEECEVEALAILGDAGLVPQLVSLGPEDATTEMRPAGLRGSMLRNARGA